MDSSWVPFCRMRQHVFAEFPNYELRYTNLILHAAYASTLHQPWSSCLWTPGTTMSFRLVKYRRLTIGHLQRFGMALQTSMESLIPINVCKQLKWLNCKPVGRVRLRIKRNIPNRKSGKSRHAILFPKTFAGQNTAIFEHRNPPPSTPQASWRCQDQ